MIEVETVAQRTEQIVHGHESDSGQSPPRDEPQISLTALLKQGIVSVDGNACGHVEDVIVRLRHNEYAQVTGLVVSNEGDQLVRLVLAEWIVDMHDDRVELRFEKWGVRPVALHEGEISLKTDILSQRVVDVVRGALVKVYDVRLARKGSGWEAVALDVHRHRWFAFGSHAGHSARDWRNFLPLGRDAALPVVPSSPNWIGRLKPAQIADLIEEADSEEQDQLLAQVHTDPELEADVFEELEEDGQAKVFKSLSDSEVANVLAHMRADDAADAVMELTQERRQPVLDLLPGQQRAKVLTLLGYNKATAGGIMGAEFLGMPENTTIEQALQGVRDAKTHQPEALITMHSIASDGRLAGTLGLVQALQADPTKSLREVADPRIVSASPEDDLLTVVNRMADFNLLTLPVLNAGGELIGVITVDDALEAAIPHEWARR